MTGQIYGEPRPCAHFDWNARDGEIDPTCLVRLPPEYQSVVGVPPPVPFSHDVRGNRGSARRRSVQIARRDCDVRGGYLVYWLCRDGDARRPRYLLERVSVLDRRVAPEAGRVYHGGARLSHASLCVLTVERASRHALLQGGDREQVARAGQVEAEDRVSALECRFHVARGVVDSSYVGGVQLVCGLHLDLDLVVGGRNRGWLREGRSPTGQEEEQADCEKGAYPLFLQL